MSLNLFLFKIKLSDLMGFLRRGKKKTEEQPKEVGKPTIYFVASDGITEYGNGGLLNYSSKIIDRNIAIDKLMEALRTPGFSYIPSTGLVFQGESVEDAKNKLLSQKSNIVSRDDINKLEEKLISEKKSKAEKKEEKPSLEGIEIPEEMKKAIEGKSGIEVEFGINVDYEKAIGGLKEWKRF